MKVLNKILFFLSISLLFYSCNSGSNAPRTPNSVVHFVELTDFAPAKDRGYSQGISAVDINGDDFPELYITNSWTRENNFYYLNIKGKYQKNKEPIFSRDGGNSAGNSFVDYNNDGFLDLAVANAFNDSNRLYIHADTSYSFLNLPTLDTGNWSFGATWADIDNNGFLDLYISNHHSQNNHLYSNYKGKLRPLRSILTRDNDLSFHAAWSDLNNDGLPDLIVSNQKENSVFKNLGNWNFEKLTERRISTEKVISYGSSMADFNNDGLMDIFIANWSGVNDLYINKGDFKFELHDKAPFSKENKYSEGSSWGDFDNDGYQDLFITNDGTNSLYRNIKGKRFEIYEIAGLTDTANNSNGTIWVDYDLDGDLDLFIANGGNQKNQFYQNQGNENNWIKLKLEGTISNRSAIGAKVTVYAKDLIQYQEVSSQSGGGVGAQKPLMLHFGLAQQTEVDSIRVIWPSAINQVYTQKEINHIHHLTEKK